MNTDPIADLLTRLRNASKARHEHVSVPASRVKKEILRVMKEEGFIQGFQEKETDGPQKVLVVELIPGKDLSLDRISKPGQRTYSPVKELRPVLRGFGIAILTTSQGIMTHRQAKKKNVGGEILCEIY